MDVDYLSACLVCELLRSMNVQVGCDWTLSKVIVLLLVVDFEFVDRSDQSLFRAGCFDLDNSDDREVGEVFFRVDESYLVDLSHFCSAF